VIFLNKTKPAFLVDAMLGNIAKKLRLLGFDTEYSSNILDEDLILRAKNENRILITKDEMLIQLSKKQNLIVIPITEEKEVNQLIQIFEGLGISKFMINGENARCTICNGDLKPINKHDIQNQIPTGILEKITQFWICQRCNKVYWEGSHIDNLQKLVVDLNEKL